MTRSKTTRLTLSGAASLLALSLAAGNAWAEEKQFNIEAQPLAKALLEFNEQSGLTVAAPRDLVQGKNAPAVRGAMEPDEALEKILSGSGLKSNELPTGAFTITLASVEATEPAPEPFRLAQLDQAEAVREVADVDEADDEDRRDVVVVTGTRIVGVKDQFSPVSQFERENLDRAGFANVADLVSSLPQNFGGGVSIDTNPAGSSFGAGAQTINLRGLGAESTLTLLNGRRLAPGGLQGSFVDISAIPLSAIDRVEVLTDGASAVYGADAIAGVVNIILREDYDGAETRLRLGTATEGDGDQIQVGQTFGKTWERGRALISYEFAKEDPILSNDKDFAAGNPPEDELLPSIKKHNLFGSGAYSLTDRFEVFLDAYYNNRQTENTSSFVFALDPETTFQDVKVEQFGGTVGFGYDLTPDWYAEVSASLADSSSFAFSDGVFSDLTDQSDTRILSYEATLGGPIFSIASENARVLFGAQYRSEDYAGLNILIPDIVSLDIESDRNVSAIFGEIYLPLINDGNARPGLHRLAINAAVRYEDYSDVGSSTNPKVGVVYSPSEGLSFRGTYGTSFRAPLLAQLVDQISFTFLSEYLDPSLPGGTAVGLFASGSTSSLKPENAETWTAGIDFTPTFAPKLQLRGTYFNIDYRDRVGSAFPSFDPATGAAFGLQTPIVVNPTAPELQAIFDASPINLDFTPSGATLADVTVLGDLRPLNTSATKVDGFDVNASYSAATDVGDWLFSLDVSYLLNFERQFSDLAPVMELLDTVGNPADLRLRGGLGWSTGRYDTNLYVNYVDGYDNDQVLGTPVPVEAWTTIDLGLRTDLSGIGGKVLDGTELTFTVRNLFDQDPPAVDRAPGALRFGYDSANADPRGRSLALQITKRW